MKKLMIVGAIIAMVFTLTGCGNDSLEGVYTKDFFDGYSFTSDGKVIYYESNWFKTVDRPTACDPEYWYGTYELEDDALTIQLSGEDEITGVIISENEIVIDGEKCELRTRPYEYNEDGQWNADSDPTWAELNDKIGF